MFKVVLINEALKEELVFVAIGDKETIETNFTEIMGRGWEISSIENIRLINSLGNDNG